jgi:methyl-accepting chemotaxis protein
MNRKAQRRIVLIDKRYQVRQISYYVGLNALTMLMFGGITYLFLDSEIQANLFSASVTYRNMREMLFPIILTLSFLNLLISSIILGGFVLYASHKVAGPLYRFKVVVDEIRQGNLKPRASIREDDQLQEFSTAMREMVETLRQDFNGIKQKVSEMEGLLAQGKPGDLAMTKLQEIKKTLDRIQV